MDCEQDGYWHKVLARSCSQMHCGCGALRWTLLKNKYLSHLEINASSWKNSNKSGFLSQLFLVSDYSSSVMLFQLQKLQRDHLENRTRVWLVNTTVLTVFTWLLPTPVRPLQERGRPTGRHHCPDTEAMPTQCSSHRHIKCFFQPVTGITLKFLNLLCMG